jgi:hypothetical protein
MCQYRDISDKFGYRFQTEEVKLNSGNTERAFLYLLFLKEKTIHSRTVPKIYFLNVFFSIPLYISVFYVVKH